MKSFKIFSVLWVVAFIGMFQQEAVCAGQPLTVKELVSMKQQLFEKHSPELSRRVTNLKYAGKEDEAALVSFLRKEVVNAQKSYKKDSSGKFEHRMLRPILEALGEMGEEKTAKVLLDWLIDWDWTSSESSPLAPAKALVLVSDRTEITKEMLKPLLNSTNPKMADMTRLMWNVIQFKDVPLDKERVVMTCLDLEKNLVRETGAMDNWEGLAMSRGYDLKKEARVASLSKLVLDSAKKTTEMEKKYRLGDYKGQDFNHLHSRERLLRYRALQELIKLDRKAAFNVLVDWMEERNGFTATVAAYLLYELTGHSEAVYAYLDYGKVRTTILVNRKAAVAWRTWLAEKGQAALKGPKKEVVTTEKRLAAFKVDRHRKQGVEYTRPVADVVNEVKTTEDLRVLTMLAKVLSTKVLDKKHVDALIAVGKATASETRRSHILQIIAVTDSLEASAYIKTIINKDADEIMVLKFITDMPSVSIRTAELLAGLYREHSSAKVKESIHALAIRRNYDKKVAAQAQVILRQCVMKDSDNEDHKFSILAAAYNKPGVNREGRALVAKALRTEKSVTFRKRLYVMVVADDPDDWLTTLLAGSEPEDTVVAALDALAREAKVSDTTYRFLDKRDLAPLRTAAEKNPSSAVQKKAAAVLQALQSKETEDLLERNGRGFSGMTAGYKSMIKNASSDQKKKLKQQFEKMVVSLENGSISDDRILNKLKEKYGNVSNEAEIRKKLTASRAVQIKNLKEIVNAL